MTVQETTLPLMHMPDRNNSRGLRDAFARFATGVTVITAASDKGPVAITANSFTSVSLAPPLVLWCLGNGSNRYETFVRAEHYAIHVLAAEQEPWCDLFAKDGAALSGLHYAENEHGVPVLPDCLARFDCVQRAVYPAGDHQLILGEVLRAGHRPGRALVFSQGDLGAHPA